MAMGIPVITNREIGDVEEIIQQNNSGIVIKDFSEAEYAEAVEKITSGNVFDPVSIRDGAVKFYDLSTAIKKYKSIYDSFLQH